MPAPESSDDLVELIKKSGVTDEAKLNACLKRLAAEDGASASKADSLAGLLIRDGILTYFQAEQLLAGKWKRFFIGRYKVLERIGSGGMGQVYLCEHKHMRRRVAVKVLPTAKSTDEASLQRFYLEARAVAALDHPNLVRAFDVDQDDNLHFLVMEYVDGSSLLEIVRKSGTMSALRAAHCIFGAAVGLQHAHEIGLVHRDIKPANILLDRSGVVKILDMGLARFFHDEEADGGITRRNDENILGTADYLSPEQSIDSHNVDIRADLYSLGGTFYFLLTGHPPFPDGSIPQKLLWHQMREPTPVRQIRPDIPQEIADIVEKLMAKKADNRYQTPGEVMNALAPWVRIPIPPPDESEMPHLSPAATGAGLGPSTPRVKSGAMLLQMNLDDSSSGIRPYAGGSGVIQNFSTTESPTAPIVRKTTPPDSNVPRIAARAATPLVEPEVDPDAMPIGDLMEADGDTDRDLDQPSDRRKSKSGKRSRSSSGSAKKLPVEDEVETPPVRTKNKGVLIAVLLGGGLIMLTAIGGIIALLMGPSPGPDPIKQVEGASRIWTVSSHAGDQFTQKSLSAALKNASAGDTIKVLDDKINDVFPIKIDKCITICAGNSANSVSLSPANAKGNPDCVFMIQSGVEDVHLSGLVLELENRVKDGVQIQGGCPGATIQSMKIRNPKRSGIQFISASGTPGREIRIDGCRVTMGDKSDVEAAVWMSKTGVNQSIVIENCILEGVGNASGVGCDSPVEKVQLIHNRIYNFQSGVNIGAKLANQGFDLAIEHNTFCNLVDGIVCQPSLRQKNQTLRLESNFFAQTQSLISSPQSPSQPNLKSVENSSDKASSEGEDIKMNPKVFDAEIKNPKRDTPDEQFLRLPVILNDGKYGDR